VIPINLYQPRQLDFTVEFPTAWNELEQKEIIFIAKCLLTEPDPAAVRALLLKFIIENRVAAGTPGVRPRLKESRNPELPEGWFLYLDPEQIVIDCYPLLDFIFKENNLTNTPGPLTFKKVIYYPQPFTKITCAEYEDCEVKANQFSSKKVPDKDLLAEIAAILFRPASGDARGEACEPEHYTLFNSRTNYYYTYQSGKKVKYFKTLSLEELYGIFIWYACSRAQLPLDFPTVYEGGKEGSEPDIMAFTKCIHSGAGPKNGTRQQIRIMELYEFMLDMEQEAIHAKEMEAEIERMKNQP